MAITMMNNVYLLFFCYCHSRTFFGFSFLLLLVSARAEQWLHPYLARPEKSSSYLQHTRNSQQTSHKVSSKGNGPATPSFTHHLWLGFKSKMSFTIVCTQWCCSEWHWVQEMAMTIYICNIYIYVCIIHTYICIIYLDMHVYMHEVPVYVDIYVCMLYICMIIWSICTIYICMYVCIYIFVNNTYIFLHQY